MKNATEEAEIFTPEVETLPNVARCIIEDTILWRKLLGSNILTPTWVRRKDFFRDIF